MAYEKTIVEKLSQFNNMSLTKKQWGIILKGCGCPKSEHFWRALREHSLQKNNRVFTLTDMTTESFKTVWNTYCKINRAGALKTYYKKKAIKEIEERRSNFTGITLYLVNGCLTTDKPERE